jgi:hypothetical protein
MMHLRLRTAAMFCAASAVGACGYRPLYATRAPGRLHVTLVRTLIADSVASDEVAAGVRDELAREGVLGAGEGYPRAEIEVLRADAASEGITGSGGSPSARATDFSVVARAWVVELPGGEPESDTGDMRATQVIAIDSSGAGNAPVDLRATVFHDTDAVRAAARRLGRLLGRRLVGEPAAGDDAVDDR